MIRKTLAAVAIAVTCVMGAAGTASAAPAPAPDRLAGPPWIAVFYFGTQTYCTQAGFAGQQMGALTAGHWMCDSGWLMVQPPEMS